MASEVTREGGADRWYRTFVRGRLVQQSALVVGGSEAQPGQADVACARDGAGRLVIPGPGLAGALIETAGRIFPELLERPVGTEPKCFQQITGKAKEPPRSGRRENGLLQSLVCVWPAHRLIGGRAERPGDSVDAESVAAPELRQGVGIRQASGGTAAERKALFDMETVPAGTQWEFFLEVDTRRGRLETERVVLLAVAEWARGRCWLGGSAARGTGWMILEDVEVVRLPLTEEAVDAWPDNRLGTGEERWKALTSVTGAKTAKGIEGLREWIDESTEPPLPESRFWYLTIDAEVRAGTADNGYGLDAVSVGGHAAAMLEPLSENLLTPEGVDGDAFRDRYNPDSPVVVTRRWHGGTLCEEPLLPGSGIRGPLRHATSRWLRGEAGGGEAIPDPNDPTWDTTKDSDDPVSRLFGLATRSARLLVRDGLLVREPAADGSKSPPFRLALFQHHAEDEFAGGVYGSGKFDRTAVIEGTFEVRLVIEAPSRKELLAHVRTLAPALRLAELGHLPLGGGKWRGFGWVPWRFTRVELWQAGDAEPKERRALRNPNRQNDWIRIALAEVVRAQAHEEDSV